MKMASEYDCGNEDTPQKPCEFNGYRKGIPRQIYLLV